MYPVRPFEFLRNLTWQEWFPRHVLPFMVQLETFLARQPLQYLNREA